MLQSITILSVVEAFIFNVPSTLGHVVQTAAADATRREVGEPVGLDDIAIRFVLAIAEDRTVSHCKLSQGSKSSASQISTRSVPSRNSRAGGWERKRFSDRKSVV